jgi:hypothetical protein
MSSQGLVLPRKGEEQIYIHPEKFQQVPQGYSHLSYCIQLRFNGLYSILQALFSNLFDHLADNGGFFTVGAGFRVTVQKNPHNLIGRVK